MSAQSSHIPGKVWLTWQTDSELTGEKHHHPHVHPFCELYFFVEGKCSYMVENGIYDMPPGTVIFTRPGEIHSVRINEPCLYEVLLPDRPGFSHRADRQDAYALFLRPSLR